MKGRLRPLKSALHKGTEPGPEAANPPRCNATGRLRHRRYELPCPSLKLSPARHTGDILLHVAPAALAR
jgi:hypothetical protein